MYLVVVLFALQPEDYNSFSENEPPFLCIEQNEQHSPEEFNDEAVISRTLSLNRARKLCAEITTTYTFSTENTNLYQYSDGTQRTISGAYIHLNVPYSVYIAFSTSPSITVFLYFIRANLIFVPLCLIN